MSDRLTDEDVLTASEWADSNEDFSFDAPAAWLHRFIRDRAAILASERDARTALEGERQLHTLRANAERIMRAEIERLRVSERDLLAALEPLYWYFVMMSSGGPDGSDLDTAVMLDAGEAAADVATRFDDLEAWATRSRGQDTPGGEPTPHA